MQCIPSCTPLINNENGGLHLTHLCRDDSATSTFWTGPFPIERVSGYFLLLSCFIENANSVDLDRTPRSVASDPVYTLCKFPFKGRQV